MSIAVTKVGSKGHFQAVMVSPRTLTHVDTYVDSAFAASVRTMDVFRHGQGPGQVTGVLVVPEETSQRDVLALLRKKVTQLETELEGSEG